MDVSIVLVSYNTKELTRECIKSIYEKTRDIDFDIWLVDNASKDNSVEMVKSEFPQVNVIENKENMGFGRANNQAINKSHAKYVLCLNTDTLLINNAVKILFDFMENPEYADVAISGGQLYNAELGFEGSIGTYHDFKWLFNKTFGLNIFSRLKKVFKSKKQTDKANENKCECDFLKSKFIIGADLMVRKSAIDRLGGFDERFFLFSEEAELCYRMKKNNYRIMFVPSAQIIHLCGGSTKSEQIEMEKLHLKSSILFFEICYNKVIAKIARILYFIYYLKYLFLRFFSRKAFRRLFMASSVLFDNFW